MSLDHLYMQRALLLAKNGLGTTAPNPMVGAVLVCNEKIIAEGYTSPYGGAHAEVNAINSVEDKSILANSTLYVTLEPCSHHGKTPPCADLIIKHNIPRVVIGTLDSHEKVAGKGKRMLEESGCKVTLGVLENACKEHHKRFLTFHQRKRPYIILKWAQTSDGFIAPDKNKRKAKAEPYWITNSYSRQIVHKWRSEEQAILVGTKTVLDDNPKLNTRSWAGTSPIRIVMDKKLNIGSNHHVLDVSSPTIVITQNTDEDKRAANIAYEVIDFSKNQTTQICQVLYKRNIISVLIEGGAKTLQTFIDENLWDEARVFTGKNNFKKGLKAPRMNKEAFKSITIESDILNIYSND
ncbi:bifunctional diaminohydroxyphosphoribosylaminopyrimidine deaminase/5-amino-6-(5-phosphoribosylamino)uracil reductase RibD [Maribacter sp. HTCC2170]|uniref:bifunctional diaminohydroxyphosphoribosylaminopyrimidine deaminase/5-amino-6-(5-phosphoribosylamino)uracil reductase RibD n=1 Tax=Maribacter sp. (strain HTCC2170 / KCCM 42371) TaxID=313603 RepID=UPI00006B4876|nr:bifunctional diaminohydroxyphosphoribosylaminopyrimidine deaminase/5-amino-6-(5-phosphoribosylamino)uracil reductase RibD [Maribacter sp. HTCC2170]EAR01537.1 putative riboflavin biosynthesis protein [Maribacter sp. HTCC2170]